MASRSPLPQMPFGYAFDTSYDPNTQFPYPSPPTPAPGPSLLDDSESHMLGDFFDRVGSAAFDGSDLLFEKALPNTGLGDVQFGWADGLPPTLHSTAASLPHTPITANSVHEIHADRRSSAMAVSPLYRPTTTSDDVLAAAALLQNGHAQMVHPMHSPDSTGLSARHASLDFAHAPLINPPLRRQSTQPYSSQHLAMQRASSAAAAVHHRANSIDVSRASYPGMMFSDPRRTNSGPATALPAHAKAVEVRWGSDVSFLDHGYVAPANQETEEDLTTDMMQNMKSFLPPAAAHHMVSPTSNLAARQRAHGLGLHTEPSPPYGSPDAVEQLMGGDAAILGMTQRKRRAAELDEYDDLDDDETSAHGKRRKKITGTPRTGRNRKASAGLDPTDRERSQSIGQKPNRENLTEEQKRSNHILSEQKRRNLIKQGFDDLCELVPNLKGGGYSKSAMLVQAADWLEDMLKGNSELRSLAASCGI